jgi:hypothetical protein
LAAISFDHALTDRLTSMIVRAFSGDRTSRSWVRRARVELSIGAARASLFMVEFQVSEDWGSREDWQLQRNRLEVCGAKADTT